MTPAITEKPFGIFEDNLVKEYTLHNQSGMQLSVINYGGIITKILTPDRQNVFANVVTGFDNLENYLYNNHYFGAIAGRYCNRIANASFYLDNKIYQLAKNDKNNSLHGGWKGFDKVWWDIKKDEESRSLYLYYLSRDGEEGYPGNLNLKVSYTLSENNSLKIEYTANTDKPTPVNLTNHSYFNLSARNDVDILGHELQFFANEYTPVNEELIPTGEIAAVKNTPLDFLSVKKIGEDISKLKAAYDHNMIINKKNKATNDLSPAASVFDPLSGRYMEMFTSEPAFQFYSGSSLKGDSEAHNNFLPHGAFCLEAQHYPDSPNEPSFPNTILKPGETYRQTTVYKFSVK